MPVKQFQPTTNLDEERIQALKQLFPEVIADGRINFETLRDMLAESLEDDADDAEHFGLFWPGKRQARRLAAQPSRGTLVPVPGEGVDEETTENIFIEGDNLEALKLLQKSYAGRIKMIYIDPPYNTGNDFIYKDDYSEPLDSYLRRTRQTDEEGALLTSNTKADGRFHSNWLNMIYPRLRLARNLLRDDGVIFVSIDDNEMHNLRQMMNEVFGEESFLGGLVWRRRQVSDNRNVNNFSTDHEYVLVYCKADGILRGTAKDLSKYSNPDNDARGSWMSDNLTGLATREQRPNLHYDIVDPATGIAYPPLASRGWAYEPKTMARLIEEGKILWPSKPDGRPRLKRFLLEIRSQFTGFSSLQDIGYNTDGTREIENLLGEKLFAFPKPVALVKALCEQATNGEGKDIILDFFVGSGTTAQAVMELNQQDGGNRRFIIIQIPEKTDNLLFPTISAITAKRVRRAINQMQNAQRDSLLREQSTDLGFRVFKLTHSNFRRWQDYNEQHVGGLLLEMERKAETPLIDGAKEQDVAAEIALLEGFALSARQTVAEEFMRNRVLRIGDRFNAHRLHVCLDREIWEETVEQIGQLPKEDVFYCFDAALSDEAKLQLAEGCRVVTI